MTIPFIGRVLQRSGHLPGADRHCPACGDGLLSGDTSIAVRGMHFHERCAGYRTRQIGLRGRG
jgi:hypothetical protein